MHLDVYVGSATSGAPYPDRLSKHFADGHRVFWALQHAVDTKALEGAEIEPGAYVARVTKAQLIAFITELQAGSVEIEHIKQAYRDALEWAVELDEGLYTLVGLES